MGLQRVQSGMNIMNAVQHVGVIGAGQMGLGIAQVMAAAGLRVTLQDISAAQLAKAVDMIAASLAKQVASGAIAATKRDSALALIGTTRDGAEAAACDLLIEAATEKEATKVAIFTALLPHLHPHTILATNTSSLSITRLAACTDRSDRFIGAHFMNPVPRMQLVEVIRGLQTSEETYQTVLALVAKVGKTAVISEDYPAFIVNRVLIPMINEAVYTLFEGVGGVLSIDRAMKLGANHPMGPFELADFIGLDTCLSIMNTLYMGLSDSKYRPCPLLVKYVEAGWLGRKAGKGFYDYSGAEPIPTR